MNSKILRVDDSLSTSFQQAQETNTIRCLEVNVEGESLVVKKSYALKDDRSVEQEWASLQAESSSPSLLLLHISPSNGPWKWILVAFVRDALPAREKMLYASARDCLKQQLGLAYFVGDVHTTELSALTYHDVIASMHNPTGPLSDREILLKEEALMERDLSVKASAMNVMPFEMTADCQAEVDSFVKDSSSKWVGLRIEDEKLSLDTSIPNFHEDKVNEVVVKERPSFVLYRYIGSAVSSATTLLLYICPEESNVRQKMTYSTAKASLLDVLQRRGIQVDKMVEITDATSVLESIHAEFTTSNVEDSRPKSFVRPAAPGRGRGRGRRS
ncbi:Twinfilin-1 [Aphanomyces cochlioides]|nr:Twinfilin-1 [Aphanomyces cochlioides]